jgi:6-phosphogluconolactonase
MSSMSRFDLIPFRDEQSLAAAFADRWLDELKATNSASPYCMALSGGRITHALFKSIAERCRKRGLSLARVHFFWADERCVPPTDRESNFIAAQQHLLEPLGIPASQVHRIQGELKEGAAAVAETEIRQIVPFNQSGQPLLDMVFLGVGEDGHVASLFPNEPEETVSSERVFRPVIASKPPPLRITLGYKAIAAARQVWVHASGAGKAQSFKESLSPQGKTPLARVLRMRERTLIFSDIAMPGN